MSGIIRKSVQRRKKFYKPFSKEFYFWWTAPQTWLFLFKNTVILSIFGKFLQTKYVKIVNDSVVGFTSKNRRVLLNCSVLYLVVFLKFLASFGGVHCKWVNGEHSALLVWDNQSSKQNDLLLKFFLVSCFLIKYRFYFLPIIHAHKFSYKNNG